MVLKTGEIDCLLRVSLTLQMMRMVSNLRNELAGISSGMARRDSFIIGSGHCDHCVVYWPV
jgi:hypothetical protein